MTDAALIESVAAALWESRRDADGLLGWPEAGEFWQDRFRELAAVAVAVGTVARLSRPEAGATA